DIRRANPYSGYENYDFEIPTEPDGDVWARYMVRMREMKESHKISVQALARLRPGPVKADAPKVVLPDREAMKSHMDALIHHFLIVAEGFDVPAGEVYQPIEASKGELGVYMKSDGGPKPSRVHFRGPSFVNLSALPMMAEGEMVADIVAIIGSLDVVLGEIDRCVRNCQRVTRCPTRSSSESSRRRFLPTWRLKLIDIWRSIRWRVR